MTEQNQTEQHTAPAGDPEHDSRHPVRCHEASVGESKNGGDQVGLRLEIVEGQFKGRQFVEYLSLSDAAMKYTIGKLRALGWEDDLTKLDTCKTKVAMATFNREPVQPTEENPNPTPGSYRVRIGWINPIGVTMAKVHDASGIARLQAKIKATAARMGSADGKPAATNAPPAARQGGSAPPAARSNSSDDDFFNDGVPPPSDRDAPGRSTQRRT